MKKTKFLILAILIAYGLEALAQKVPEIEKKTYISPDGKMYVQKALPIYLYLSTKPNENQNAVMLKSEHTPKYANPMYFDSEGLNTIRSPWAVDPVTKELKYPKEDIIYEVYADSKPPVTSIKMGDSKKLSKNGKLYLNGRTDISFSAVDALSGVDKIMVSINQAEYTEYKTPIALDEEKEYEIKYFSYDNVGNVEALKSIIIVIDKSSPKSELEIKGDQSENTLSGKTLLILKCSDNSSGVSRLMVKIDENTEKPYSSAINTAYLEQGEHKLTYFAADNVENIEEPHVFEFYVDKTPPTILQEIIGKSFMVNGREFSSGRSQLKLTTLDNKAGIKEVYYSINNGEFKLYEKPVTLNIVSGNISIKAYAVDKVNNKSQVSEDAEATAVPYIDLSGPSLKFSFTGPVFYSTDTIYISSKTKINLKAYDPEAGINKISYRINDKDENTYTAPFSIDSEGLYTIKYTGTDNVDNTNTSSFILVVDNTGPSIYTRFSTLPKGSETINGKNLTLYPSHVDLFIAATDSICGYDRMTFSTNGSKEKLFTGFLNSFTKTNSIIVKAYDKLGNENTKEIDFSIKN